MVHAAILGERAGEASVFFVLETMHAVEINYKEYRTENRI